MDSDNSNSSMEMATEEHLQLAGKSATPTQHANNESDTESEDQWHWRCQPIEAVQRGLQPYELDHVGAVVPGPQHKVLYRQPIREPSTEPPRPYRAGHRWDAEHVRLPCAAESKYPVESPDGTSEIHSRWQMIERALLRPINNSKQLQAAILSYNTTYKNQWSFSALHKLFEDELDESETRVFFEDLLPRIIRLALHLPKLIQSPIPLLKQNQPLALTLTQEQISCLLANAFLCTYPRRNTLKRKSEYSNFPDINFNRLYKASGAAVLEKLKCIMHYFRRVCPTERDASNVPTGCVTFQRLCGEPEQQVQWHLSTAGLASIPMHINAGGTIEDQGLGLLQVDFANQYLGGGVLGYGCVQEEIRFVICPELIVSKLFTECLLPTEALLMVGCERYSNYKGYASTFVWEGNHEDHTPYDSCRRRRTAIVAIDALSFGKSSQAQQYREDLMLRELNKASIGFKPLLATPPPGVATGNWGCGAFGGDPYLKALLQLMVCAHHGRPLAYFTFGNCRLRDDLHTLWQLCHVLGTTVQQLWSILRRYKKDSGSRRLYTFVLEEIKKLHAAKETPQSTPTTAAAKQPSNQQSPDLFADCSNGSLNNISMLSDDEEQEMVAVAIAATASASDDHSEQLDLDQEQELMANAMMLAASLESNGSCSSNSNSNNSGVASTSQPRQRTLLEMLDRHYDQGQSNGSSSKRHHQSGSAELASKARKDSRDGDASKRHH